MQTYDPNSTKQHWQVKDIIFLALLAAFFGLIYQGASYLYYALAATFLKPYANDLMLGIWLMAGPLAAILLKRRGAAFLGEFLAATAEMLLFSSWGAANLITGALQGSAGELGFLTCGYKNFGKKALTLSVIFSASVTFAWDYFQSGYQAYPLSMLLTLFSIRLLSLAFFDGVLIYQIAKLVSKAKVRV